MTVAMLDDMASRLRHRSQIVKGYTDRFEITNRRPVRRDAEEYPVEARAIEIIHSSYLMCSN